MKKILLIGTVTMLLAGQVFSADSNEAYKAYLAKYASEHPDENISISSESNATVSESNATVVKYKEMTAEEAENILKNKQKSSKKIGTMTSVNGGGVAGAAIGAALLGATFIYNKIVDSIEGDK